MSRRLLLACLCAVWTLLSSAQDLKQPNIAVFILDDVGQSDLGTYGHPIVKTPNIDRIARKGMRFDNAFLTTSSCSSSRASILTGLYPHNTGAATLGTPLPAAIDSLPQRLQRAGYYTASVGKWHLGEPFKSHFDRVVELREPSGAVDWLPEFARRPKDKPFFFWFASLDAHIPYDWSPPLLSYSPNQAQVYPWSVDTVFERSQIALYYNEITRADRRIGEVVDAMQRAGVLDNTLVVVLSDNGAMFGGAKTSLYDEGIRTPLVLRYPPRITAGRRNTQLVSSIDLMPTLLAAAGVPTPTGLPGVSLWPTLKQPDRPVRQYIFAERNTHAVPMFERALRTPRYLYKRNYLHRRLCDPDASLLIGTKLRERVFEEFYDLVRDPSAQQNLAQHREYQADQLALGAQMSQLMQDTRDAAPPLMLEQCEPLPWDRRIELQWPVETESM